MPRRPPRPDAKQARETAEVIGIAQESQWPVGPSPESLVRKTEGDRTSDSSCEESDSRSNSSFQSSPASSISSPFHGNKIPLVGIDDITVDESVLTFRVLSRLRDLYELANGWVCLDDNYTPPAPVPGENDELEGLGIKLENLSTEGKKGAVDVVKKIMGQNNVKRSNIVREIIETEESYIRGLQELVDVRFPQSHESDFRYTLTILYPHMLRRMTPASSSDTSKSSLTFTRTFFSQL